MSASSRWPRWSRLASSAVWLGYWGPIVSQMRVPLESPPDGGSALPPGVPVTTLTGIRLASLGTKVRAAEAHIPYAGSARRATLAIVGGHVAHHRR
jgi:hypothetical protein